MEYYWGRCAVEVDYVTHVCSDDSYIMLAMYEVQHCENANEMAMLPSRCNVRTEN